MINQFDDLKLIDNVKNDCDGTPLSTPQTSAKSSQDGGGHYNPVGTVLDGAAGFSKGWEKTSNKARYKCFNKPHAKGLWGAKPGASKKALNRATTKGLLSRKCLSRTSAAVGVVDIGIGLIQDGGHPGVNTAGSVGSVLGGWGGARAGAAAGVAIGASFGPYGAIIGGIVGGISGGLGGSAVGDKAGREIYKSINSTR